MKPTRLLLGCLMVAMLAPPSQAGTAITHSYSWTEEEAVAAWLIPRPGPFDTLYFIRARRVVTTTVGSVHPGVTANTEAEILTGSCKAIKDDPHNYWCRNTSPITVPLSAEQFTMDGISQASLQFEYRERAIRIDWKADVSTIDPKWASSLPGSIDFSLSFKQKSNAQGVFLDREFHASSPFARPARMSSTFFYSASAI